MENKSLYQSLARIQSRLSVPKTRTMRIGGAQVQYRNAEDIYSAVKPLCAAEGLAVIAQCDDLESGLLKCTVGLYGEDGQNISTSFSVPVDAGGATSGAQRKGAARSYALKYALCNLFAIDDGIDDDTLTNDGGAKKPAATLEQAIAELGKAKTMADLVKLATKYAVFKTEPRYITAGQEAQQRIKEAAQ